ncbi:sigma-54 dependent transcriptional regulator [Desulfopila aestuarii]|uniref:PAS domain S-box-containing protein n=1 Tax=Desulfopila aestuarii DSM 18488 TaxID=1121416 RepID=A0A1M7XZN2_9BACT|nr:sigma-54-dependent Fis family transcriptional regulator [Desulfopila aestuarii]SHO44678.1 PAS domain S-box-containing protein [Desulfopila aestuarii DSM 18488]
MSESHSDIHILIVDDEESIRFTFEMFLRREGYGFITTAATLDEALKAVEKENFDLVISDIVLANSSGTELLKYVRSKGQECPVVMITGFPNLNTAAEAVRYGAFDYIAKPVNKETLLRFVRQALKHWDLEREKRSLQQENEKYRRYLEVVFSSVSDAIVTVDEELNIVQLNETARRWFSEIEKAPVTSLKQLPGEMASACLQDAGKVIRDGQTVREHQVECHNNNGEKRMVSLTAAPLRDEIEELSGAVLVLRDITMGVPVEVQEGERTSFHGFIGTSRIMQGLYRLIENVGKVDTAVLVTGESGTGKELTAEALHLESLRRTMPLVKVDCASVPEDLLESELFGHRKGAFTGADRDRPGRLFQADHGTLFLDEIGDISPRMQLRLLRFLQEQTFTPVGQDSPIQVDVRVIAATNVDLHEKVRAGQFREDLYYRLKVVEIHLPPLRERRECIPLLVNHFLRRYAEKLGRNISSISDQSMQILSGYSWPGNVRELSHVIERGCVLCTGSTIQIEHLPQELVKRPVRDDIPAVVTTRPVVEYGENDVDTEKEQLLKTLGRAGGNKARAARMLGIDRSTLYRKLKRYRIVIDSLS